MEIKITIKTKLEFTDHFYLIIKRMQINLYQDYTILYLRVREITLHINHAETKISSLDIQGVEITY